MPSFSLVDIHNLRGDAEGIHKLLRKKEERKKMVGQKKKKKRSRVSIDPGSSRCANPAASLSLVSILQALSAELRERRETRISILPNSVHTPQPFNTGESTRQFYMAENPPSLSI